MRAMDADPQIDDILTTGGEALGRGDLEAARAALKRAEEIDPIDRDVLLFRGALHMRTGELDVAEAAVEAVVEHHGDDPIALYSAAGMILDLDGDPEDALSLAEEADSLFEDMEIDPEDEAAARETRVDVLSLVSECRLGVGDRSGAQAAAEQALALGGEFAGAYTALGRATFARGQLAAAKAAFTRALELDPEEGEVAWNLGWVNRLLGDDAAADKAFLHAARIDAEVFPLPGQFTEAFLRDVTTDIAVALESPFDDMLRDVPIVIADLPAVEVDSERGPMAVVRVERESAAEDAPIKRLHVYRRNVEVMANDADAAVGVLEAHIVDELTALVDVDELLGDEPS